MSKSAAVCSRWFDGSAPDPVSPRLRADALHQAIARSQGGFTLRLPFAIAALILLHACIVMAGWINSSPTPITTEAGPLMVFNTALCFALMGLAIVLEKPERPHAPRLQTLAATMVILISVLVLAQYLTGLDLGIDAPGLHRWIENDNPDPGRMAKATAFSFLLCGCAMLLMPRVRKLWQGLLLQCLTALPALIGLAALAGLQLDLRYVYPDYLLAQMSATTAICFIGISTALWLNWREAGWYGARNLITNEGQRLGLFSAMILAAVTSFAVLAGFNAAQRELETAISDGLLQVLRNSTKSLKLIVDHRIVRAQTIVSQDSVHRHLSELDANENAAEAREKLRSIAERFLPLGFSGIAFISSSGRELARVGQLANRPEWSSRLDAPYSAQLLLSGGWLLLNTSMPVSSGGKTIGTIVAEQNLTALAAILSDIEALGQTSEIGICKLQNSRFLCLPQRLTPTVFSTPYSETLPMSRATAGKTGVERTRDYRNEPVIAAHGPLNAQGLGMVVKIDSAELFAPIRQRLNIMLPLLLLLSAGGGFFLYSRLRPLVGEIEHSRETIRARGEQALRHSENRLSGIISSAMDAIISVDENHVILLFNKAAEDMFQYRATDIIGKRLDLLLPRRYRETHAAHIRKFAESGVTTRAMGHLGSISGLRANGEEFPIEASISQVRETGGKILTVILRDITERRKVESDLRQSLSQQQHLSRRLAEVEEEERRKINRELHDRIGQNLAALGLNMALIRSGLPQPAPGAVGKRINDAEALLQATSEQVRNVMAELRPLALDDYGLFAALRAYAGPYAERASVTVEFRGQEPHRRLPRFVESALFRIAQEALNNIAKHARASRVVIAFEQGDDATTMTISDDGIGFDTGQAAGSTWGMATMRERADAVGARLLVESTPGGGTRISVKAAHPPA